MTASVQVTKEPENPEPYLLLNRQRKYRVDRPDCLKFLTILVEHLHPQGTFSVVLVSDRVMRSYNSRYRGLDEPTDVLSFPCDGAYMGDVLVSTETAYKQVRHSRKLTFESNLKRLMLHGLLHLMGYDHEIDGGEMRILERRIRRRLRC